MSRAYKGLGALALASIVVTGGVASAQQVNNWSQTNDNLHSSAAINATYKSGNTDVGYTFYTVNTKLYGRNLTDTGKAVAQPYTMGGTVDSFPQAVQLADGKWYIFVASQDGYLYKFDLANSIANPAMPFQLASTSGVAQKMDLRRVASLSCTTKDSITASPAVFLKAYANASYTAGKDLVIVPTHHGCGSLSTNIVYALDASDITKVVWSFNSNAIYQVDYASEGCSLDYDRNQIYCGTHLDPYRYQNTVWAISLNNGSLVWGANANSVTNRPQLGRSSPEHLYVADMIGRVHAYDPDTGTEDWSLVVSGSPGVYFSQNLWAEWRGNYANTLYVTDSSGSMHSIYDGGAFDGAGEVQWSRTIPSRKIKSLGSISPTLGKAYVGTDYGSVYQLNLMNGATEGYAVIANATVETASNTVTDPTLFVPGGAGTGNDISKMVASSWGTTGGITKQFSIPLSVGAGYSSITCTSDFDCKSFDNGVCATGTCAAPDAAGNRYCYSAIAPSSTSCNDQNSCTSSDHCRSGQCVGTWTCAPVSSGCTSNRECGAGKVCFQPYSAITVPPKVCVDVDGGSDGYKVCGSTGRTCANATVSSNPTASTWGGDRVCVNGVCQRDTSNVCNDTTTDPFKDPIRLPTDAQLSTTAVGSDPAGKYAVGLDFGRTVQSGKTTCTGYMTTYDQGTSLSGTATASFRGNGTICATCGTNIWACVGGASGCSATITSDNFTDPLATTYGAEVATRVRVTLSGKQHAGSATGGTVSVYLYNPSTGNQTLLGTKTLLGTTASTCGSCVASMVVLTFTDTGGITNYEYGGSMQIRITTSGGNWDFEQATVQVVGRGANNYLRKIPAASGTPTAYLHTGHQAYGGEQLGYAGSVTASWTANGGSVNYVLANFINDPGIFDGTGIGTLGYPNASTYMVFNSSPTPVNTSSPTAGLPFNNDKFNQGPTNLAWNGTDMSTASGQFWIGNWQANGDLYAFSRYCFVLASTTICYWPANTATGATPPWCPAAGCSAWTDRITALAYPTPIVTSGTNLSDGLLRVAHGTTLEFYDTSAQSIVYSLDFASTAQPGESSGGVPWLNGQAKAILSISVDPMNGTNDTYVELKDTNGSTVLLQVRGDDHSVRPLASYAVPGGSTVVGVLDDMHIPVASQPTTFTNEGRITVSSQSKLHRIVPVAPDAATSTTATVTSYLTAP